MKERFILNTFDGITIIKQPPAKPDKVNNTEEGK
jgi:hypothetical protein